MAVFRACLGLGVATVLVLGLAKLYPVALIAGAVLLPVLVVMYMVDVNVFEEQSLPVIAGTLLWGLRGRRRDGPDRRRRCLAVGQRRVRRRRTAGIVLTRGVLIPLLSVVLILAGPLTMLRYPRFSTVLDGATFAAASASAFVAAEVIVQALSALGHGLRPPGSVVPWLVQLATIAIALPLVTMAAMAAIAGAVWLKRPGADQGPPGARPARLAVRRGPRRRRVPRRLGDRADHAAERCLRWRSSRCWRCSRCCGCGR